MAKGKSNVKLTGPRTQNRYWVLGFVNLYCTPSMVNLKKRISLLLPRSRIVSVNIKPRAKPNLVTEYL
jgi:hypothetical protein